MAAAGPGFDRRLWRNALACKCPRCGRGDLFKRGFLNLTFHDHCAVCRFPLAKNDNGDGPAVFLIFLLGFLLVPLALWVDDLFAPPLWLHAVIWTVAALGLTLGLLRQAKAFTLGLEVKYRSADTPS